MSEKTKRCPVCGASYKVYMFYAGDQSACPRCVREAEENMACHKSAMEACERAKWQRQQQGKKQ
jgi:uncharacterized paraquat-inducible protein A